MNVSDFNSSYIRWTTAPNPADLRVPGHMRWGNTVRIGIEARCEISDERNGETKEYVLIKPCRTEWMYRDETLLQEPSKEFRMIWSSTEALSVGHGMTYNIIGIADSNHDSDPMPVNLDERYLEHSMTIRHLDKVKELKDIDQILRATLDHQPLIARTEVRDTDAQMNGLLEYPIETMNIHPERRRFQVDAGPILFPDFRKQTQSIIKMLSVAFICYNTFDKADFVVRQPTPIVVDDREVCQIPHYSDFRRAVNVKTSIFVADNT